MSFTSKNDQKILSNFICQKYTDKNTVIKVPILDSNACLEGRQPSSVHLLGQLTFYCDNVVSFHFLL